MEKYKAVRRQSRRVEQLLMTVRETIAANVKGLRDSIGMTQADLAEKTGLNIPAIETTEIGADVEGCILIAEVFDVPPQEIWTGKRGTRPAEEAPSLCRRARVDLLAETGDLRELEDYALALCDELDATERVQAGYFELGKAATRHISASTSLSQSILSAVTEFTTTTGWTPTCWQSWRPTKQRLGSSLRLMARVSQAVLDYSAEIQRNPKE